MSIPFMCIATACAAPPEGEENFRGERESSGKSECLLIPRLACFRNEERFRLTVCPEARQARSGRTKLLSRRRLRLQPARREFGGGAFPRNAVFMHRRER